jgi:hypothetical protein
VNDDLLAPLRAFRFLPAIGGHANDGDALVLRLGPVAALEEICRGLGLRLEPALPDEPQPRPGVAYRAGEMEAFRSLAAGTPWVQPGHVEIGGERVFAWIDDRGLLLTVAGRGGDPYAVTAADVAAAQAIEARALDAVAAYVIDPPDKRCLPGRAG